MNLKPENNVNAKDVKAVLFVDDEFDDTEQAHLQNAVERLREAGYDVTTVTTMAEAVDCYMNHFYHVFVLDLDMHKTLTRDAFQKNDSGKTPGQPPEKRGGDLAKVYKSIDNGSAIVIFSGAGTVEDMYKLANCHVCGYVRKEPGCVERLVRQVGDAARLFDDSLRVTNPRKDGKIMVVQTSGMPTPPETWRQIASGLDGQFELEFVPMEQAAEALGRGDYAAVCIAEAQFSPHDMPTLQAICRFQPRPHVVMASNCNRENFDGLMDIVNLRPFRLVNLLVANREEALKNALIDALNFYDAWETFEASMEYVNRAGSMIDWEPLANERDTLAMEADPDDGIAAHEECQDDTPVS